MTASAARGFNIALWMLDEGATGSFTHVLHGTPSIRVGLTCHPNKTIVPSKAEVDAPLYKYIRVMGSASASPSAATEGLDHAVPLAAKEGGLDPPMNGILGNALITGVGCSAQCLKRL